MKALRKNVMVAATMPTVAKFDRFAKAANETLAAPAAATRYPHAKNIAMLAAAPVVGLAYIVAFPVIGLALLAWMAARPLVKRWEAIARFAKNAVLFFAAPFIGLAYAAAFPFVALGMLVWKGARAAAKR